jgi:release factor glutamine methyltransferase
VRALVSFVPVLLARRFILPRRRSVQWMGVALVVEPGVFHPRLYFTTSILGRHVRGRFLHGRSVLDLGTGSGALGLLAARGGARVLAVDCDPVAAFCAAANAARNGLTSRVSVLCGDLCDALSHTVLFDLVIWNPPFYPESVGNRRPAFWFAGENYSVLQRSARQIAPRLRPEGVLLLLLSSDMDEERVLGFFRDAGLLVRIARRHYRILERFTVYELRRPRT